MGQSAKATFVHGSGPPREVAAMLDESRPALQQPKEPVHAGTSAPREPASALDGPDRPTAC